MSAEGVVPVQVLRPVLDTYLKNPVGVVGCRSYGISRPACEYDVLIVSDEPRSSGSVKIGTDYMDLAFSSEREVLKPSSPESAVSLASLYPVRDTTLVFSTATSAARALLRVNSAAASQARLGSALKGLGRVDEALGKEAVIDADYWLLNAAYDFAFAWLYGQQTSPAPSHLLDQLRNISRGQSAKFEAFSASAGLERSSRRSCGDRLEGLSVLADAMGASRIKESEESPTSSSRTEFEILKRKSDSLVQTLRNVDCFAFLGFQLCEYVPAASKVHSRNLGAEADPSMLVGSLSLGSEKLISPRVTRQLGLVRSAKTIGDCAASLKEEIADLSKTS